MRTLSFTSCALIGGVAAATALQCDGAACESEAHGRQLEPLGPLGRALSCSAFAAVTIPVVLLASRTWLALLALVVAVAGAFYQLEVMGLRSDFWTHIVVGTALCRASWFALKVGHVRMAWKYGAIGAGLTSMIMVGLVMKTDMWRVYNQMHQLINIGQVALFITISAEDFLENSARLVHAIHPLFTPLPSTSYR